MSRPAGAPRRRLCSSIQERRPRWDPHREASRRRDRVARSGSSHRRARYTAGLRRTLSRTETLVVPPVAKTGPTSTTPWDAHSPPAHSLGGPGGARTRNRRIMSQTRAIPDRPRASREIPLSRRAEAPTRRSRVSLGTSCSAPLSDIRVRNVCEPRRPPARRGDSPAASTLRPVRDCEALPTGPPMPLRQAASRSPPRWRAPSFAMPPPCPPTIVLRGSESAWSA